MSMKSLYVPLSQKQFIYCVKCLIWCVSLLWSCETVFLTVFSVNDENILMVTLLFSAACTSCHLMMVLREVPAENIARPLGRNEVIGLLFRLTIFGAVTYFTIKWMVDAIDPTRKQKVEAQKQVRQVGLFWYQNGKRLQYDLKCWMEYWRVCESTT